jgi:hypothetical protein
MIEIKGKTDNPQNVWHLIINKKLYPSVWIYSFRLCPYDKGTVFLAY